VTGGERDNILKFAAGNNKRGSECRGDSCSPLPLISINERSVAQLIDSSSSGKPNQSLDSSASNLSTAECAEFQ